MRPHFFAALINAMELPETLLEISLSDQKSQKRLKKILKKRFLDRPWSEWEVVFADCDTCVELVLEFSEASENSKTSSTQVSQSANTTSHSDHGRSKKRFLRIFFNLF